jgi:hypothetical protein
MHSSTCPWLLRKVHLWLLRGLVAGTGIQFLEF